LLVAPAGAVILWNDPDIGQYALEYFQMTGIQCEPDIPAQLPPYPLSFQMRHHLFPATHEAITNILESRPGQGTSIRFVISLKDPAKDV